MSLDSESEREQLYKDEKTDFQYREIQRNHSDGQLSSVQVPAVNAVNVEEFKLYKRRWFVLLLVTLHATSAQMIWLSFSPVATEAAEVYSVNPSSINLFSLIYLILSIPMGFVATWLLDTFGIRLSLILASWVNTIGGIIRVLSTMDFVSSTYTFPVAMAGQVVAAMAYPVFISCPSKVSNKWFPKNHRTFATMVASFPGGYLFANLISPRLFKDAEHLHGMQLLLIVYSIPAAVGTVLATFGMCSSVPPTPPSAAAQQQDEPFWPGLKKILRIKAYWLLLLCIGCGIGLFNAIILLLEQILCSNGYPVIFSGICGALVIGVGLIGMITFSLILDITKLYEEITKIAMVIGVSSIIVFEMILVIPDIEPVLIVLASLSGFGILASVPLTLELAVETTYPIAQATSAGLIIVSGHIQGIAYTFIMQALKRPLPEYKIKTQTCVQNATSSQDKELPQDMTVSTMFSGGLLAAAVIIFIVFFKTDCKRRKMELSASVNVQKKEISERTPVC
ncbi:solute carrier family 49 member A3-like [Saccoglossus kowalevskii]|uniref:Major facilitator superfamily domain-containing protein 7-like n=1 Tax=Saccoglossus kowalevskii TaxID=10224 RepID=A0ABM0GXR1_SACKO|nr:PREDICTED: major facilitator superfamily domain-containing protein 7-like [Saccoglossus kowalevskii]